MTRTYMMLSTEERKKFDEIEGLVAARRSFANSFDRTVLLDLFALIGPVTLLFTITQCMENEWLKPSRWRELAGVVQKYGIDRTRKAIAALNRLENHSIAMVEKLCENPKLAERTAPNAKPEPARPKQERPYPPVDHRYLQSEAGRWLVEHDKPLGTVLEHFENGGRDADGNQLYLLKSEYR